VNILQVISEHDRFLLEIEWDEICRETKVERIFPVFHRTVVSGFQDFLRDKFNLWDGNGSFIEDIWNHFKDIVFEGIKCFVLQKF
jgi:hypothetical protein